MSGKLSFLADSPSSSGAASRPGSSLTRQHTYYSHPPQTPRGNQECLRPGCHSNSYSLKDSVSRDPGECSPVPCQGRGAADGGGGWCGPGPGRLDSLASWLEAEDNGPACKSVLWTAPKCPLHRRSSQFPSVTQWKMT